MSTWSAGYVSEVGYTFGVYPELNPTRCNLALLNAGLAVPKIKTACELGFGQGLGINVHAAASDIEWYGTDFNPSQAAFARELAQASGAPVHLHDESFAQFCARDDLPDFDFIGLHGIWSWISEENRKIILDFLARKLKVGGVAYVSYNTQPGWTNMLPLRDLVAQYDRVMCFPGQNILSRVDQSVDFADKLLAAAPQFRAANPLLAERVKGLKKHPKSYLAHEYFNRDWKPMLFSQIAEQLDEAKLSFGGSADYFRQLPTLNCNAEQLALLGQFEDAAFRETLSDFMTNQQFRKDYWLRGPRKIGNSMRTECLRAQRVVLAAPVQNLSLKVNTALGEATLQEEVYRPVLDALSDYAPRSIAELERACEGKLTFPKLAEAVFILVASAQVQPAQSDEVIEQARPRTRRLNASLCELSRDTPDLPQLASPVTGGGILVHRFHQLFLLSRSRGRTQPAGWVDDVTNLLNAQNERLSRNGEHLSTDAQYDELSRMASEFAAAYLPMLIGLGIA